MNLPNKIKPVVIDLPKNQSLTITFEDVKQYINPLATTSEIIFFLQLCRTYQLNPFAKEIHLIKYGNADASIVVGKDAFTKRANSQPDYKGFKAGIIVYDHNQKTLIDLEGAFYNKQHQTIVGGWAQVYRKNKEPFTNRVSFDEYAAKTKDGSLNRQWSSKPATMIRKVALVHSLREAFPEVFAGLYDSCEMGDIDTTNLDKQAIEAESVELINDDQVNIIKQYLEQTRKVDEQKICNAYGIDSLNKIPVDKYDMCIQRLENYVDQEADYESV